MQSGIVNRWVRVGGHNKTVTLEDEFWDALCEIAQRWRVTPSELIEEINEHRKQGKNLSSAIRVFVLQFFKDQTSPSQSQQPKDDALRLAS
jgi:predicted DNA-binding ribbon-helix-helix protein